MTRAVRAAAVVTTLTADQAARVRAVLPDLRAPIRVVPHGVDVRGTRDPQARRRWGVPPGVPLLVHVAGLRREKGFPQAFALVDRIRAAVPDLAYVLAGPVIDPKLVPEADAFFRDRPWAVRAGSLPRAETLDLVAAATCTLHASTVEGLSNALLESMALGVVPVARDIAASRAAIDDGRSGVLFADDDEAAVWVARLSGDPALRATIGETARAEAVRRFSPEAEVRGYVAAYSAGQKLGPPEGPAIPGGAWRSRE